eukprot:1671834-Pyramimonas_sp.AAC.1
MESQAFVQAFIAGAPEVTFVPPGSLAPGEYGPRTLLQTLMRMHEDTDACGDSELVLAALTLVDSVRPEDVQRHVLYSRGRLRDALDRAIAMRGQALPPPGW